MRVRQAVPGDFTAIVGLAVQMIQELGQTDGPPVTSSKVISAVHESIQRGAFVAEENGRVVGALGLFDLAVWWSEEKLLSEMIYWVLPEYRKTGAYGALLKEARKYAIMQGKKLYIQFHSRSDLDRREAFFDRAGLVKVGAIYYDGLNE